jgi:hypothetical protein
MKISLGHSNFFENSQRYSRVKVHHQYQRHHRQILPQVSLVLLILVANLPPVSMVPAANLPPVSLTINNKNKITLNCTVHAQLLHSYLYSKGRDLTFFYYSWIICIFCYCICLLQIIKKLIYGNDNGIFISFNPTLSIKGQ